MRLSDSFLLQVIVFFVLLCLAGCAPSPPSLIEESPEEVVRVPQDESFDPLSFEGGDIIELPESKLKTISPETTLESSIKTTETTPLETEVPGYRVQIFATILEFEARATEEKALIEFDESVYLIFDSPSYKVRVGDCLTRAEANELRQKAVSSGYRDAWVVQCKVIASNLR